MQFVILFLISAFSCQLLNAAPGASPTPLESARQERLHAFIHGDYRLDSGHYDYMRKEVSLALNSSANIISDGRPLVVFEAGRVMPTKVLDIALIETIVGRLEVFLQNQNVQRHYQAGDHQAGRFVDDLKQAVALIFHCEHISGREVDAPYLKANYHLVPESVEYWNRYFNDLSERALPVPEGPAPMADTL